MSGGEISGNTSSVYGGGVIAHGTFTMESGKIFGNTATHSGGGVHVFDGTFTMIGGEISGNTSGGSGGGVTIGDGTFFTMRGGEISGNTASGGMGGGVYVSKAGTFSKIGGGTIYGYSGGDTKSNVVKNTSSVQNNSGHAVYVSTSPSKRRETTAGPTVNLDSAIDGAAGGWE